MFWYWDLSLDLTLGMSLNPSKLYFSHWQNGGNLPRKDSARSDGSSVIRPLPLSLLSPELTLLWPHWPRYDTFMPIFQLLPEWFLLPGGFFSQIFSQLAPCCPWGLSVNITSSEKPRWATILHSLQHLQGLISSYLQSFPWLLSVCPTSVSSRSTRNLPVSFTAGLQMLRAVLGTEWQEVPPDPRTTRG